MCGFCGFVGGRGEGVGGFAFQRHSEGAKQILGGAGKGNCPPGSRRSIEGEQRAELGV